MNIKSLRLFNFRNFREQEIELRPGICFFVGKNGQGKTNILEAIYLLSQGESFRMAQAEHYINHNLDQNVVGRARIQAKLSKEIGPNANGDHIEHLLMFDLSSTKRVLHLDGKRTGFSTASRLFPLVLFSPESLSVIKNGPEERRKLIDQVVRTKSTQAMNTLKDFQKSLRARNALLRQIAEGDQRKESRDTLESLTKIFLLLATQVSELRIQTLKELQPRFNRTAEQIFSGKKILASGPADQDAANGIRFSFDYQISSKSVINWSAEEIYNALYQRYIELQAREIQYGASLIGPHKHDFRIEIDKADSRFYGSQGQQRALILAFKIAQIDLHHARSGHYPVLLLDDVMSELDFDKRNRLMDYLEQTCAQVMITATDLTWSRRFSSDRNAVFMVEQGTVDLATRSAVNDVRIPDEREDAFM